MQDLERGVIPENERPEKLSELCKLCGTNKSIPDSMKIQGYGNEVKEYNGTSSVHQSKFKGRKVAIEVTRLYISRKLEDHLGVSTVFYVPPLRPHPDMMSCRGSAKRLWRGSIFITQTFYRSLGQRSRRTGCALFLSGWIKGTSSSTSNKKKTSK